MRPGQHFLESRPREAVRFVGPIRRLNTTTLGVIVLAITAWTQPSAWSPLSAQATIRISPEERPTWVVDGVPDSVWTLVEASWTTDDKDRKKKILELAETHARAASEGHSDDVGQRFGLAVVLASRADVEGGRAQILTAARMPSPGGSPRIS